jgi:multidrug efflux system membrane fusion protein
VITKDVPLYLDEIGTCAAYETVQVQAQVSGQIVARNFKDGQDVQKGDLLFTIDPRPYQAVLDSAKADLVLAKANMARQEELRAKDVTARQDWDTAKATAMKAQAVVDAAQVNLDYCSIRSPIDGRIGLRQVDVGNTVSAGASSAVLVTIDNLDPIYTDFTIAEPDMPQVRKYLGGPNVKVLTQPPNGKVSPRSGTLYLFANTVRAGPAPCRRAASRRITTVCSGPLSSSMCALSSTFLKNATLVPNDAVADGSERSVCFRGSNRPDARPTTGYAGSTPGWRTRRHHEGA